MPDARILALRDVGLDVVPGYRIDPTTGREDETWRKRHFVWHENIRDWRVWAQEKYASDADFRDDILTLCQRDPAFFNILFMDIEEPRAVEFFDSEGDHEAVLSERVKGLYEEREYEIGAADLSYRTIHPLIPFSYQVQAWRDLTYIILGPLRSEEFDILWDKARGIGMSYAFLAWAYWAWLFVPGLRGTILTEKWDKAERTNDLNSLFGKLDLFIAATPEILLPTGFVNRGEKGAHRLKGSLLNPDTGAAIFTEPTTADSTRGGRAAYVAIDECAFHEYLDETWATVAGTTFHRCGWSSASYRFGRQWERKVKRARDFPESAMVRVLEYYENPHQDAVWERRARAKFQAAGQEEQFEVEYLRNAAAGSGRLIYKAQLEMVPLTDEGYDPHKDLKISVDPGTDDFSAFCLWQTHYDTGKKLIRFIDGIQLDKMPVQFWAHVMTGFEPRSSWTDGDGLAHEADEAYRLLLEGFFEVGRIREMMEFMQGVDPRHIHLYGDPSMQRKDVTHESWISIFERTTLMIREREFGQTNPKSVPIMCNLPWKLLYKRNNFQDRRAGMRRALMMAEFSKTPGALEFREALEEALMQEITERSTRAPGTLHNIHSHYVQAGEFGMIWETLDLTPEEVEPERLAKIEQPKQMGGGGLHRPRNAGQIAGRNARRGGLSSTVGVA